MLSQPSNGGHDGAWGYDVARRLFDNLGVSMTQTQNVSTVDIVREAAEYVRQGIGNLPILAEGRNCKVRHLPGEVDGDKGQVVIVIDLNTNVGPSSSGKNVMIGTMGRNVTFKQGTLGLNFWREGDSAEERADLLKQAERAAERKALEDKLKALNGK